MGAGCMFRFSLFGKFHTLQLFPVALSFLLFPDLSRMSDSKSLRCNRGKSNFQYVCDRLKHFHSLRMCDISPKQTNIDLFIYSFIQRMPLLANSTSNYRTEGSSLMEITAASTGPPSLFSILDRMQISIARIIQRYLAKERK